MLNENLKRLRKNKGLTQEQFALQLNVVRQTVSKWEQGLSVPDAEMLMKIADILNVSVSDLLGEEVAENNDISPLTGIALELEKLNQMLVAEKIRRKSLQKKIITAGAIVILVILIIAVYPQWNQMFYEFGRNLYGCVG
ncbi:helix-turn-helix domain-containing protein [Oscillospiraceae bacterium LCP25S3_E10]